MTTLSVGLPNFGSWFPAIGDLVDATVALEAAGVDRVVLVDHVVLGPDTDAYPWGRFPTGPDADWHEPLITLTAVARATERIRLGTGILVAGLRPAALLAKSVATLDVLSGGRVDLGVGTGWQPAEFQALGLDFDRRGSLLDDVIGACRVLWEQAPASFESPSVRFDQVWCRPAPVQARPPIWFAGSLGARTLRRIVTLGDGWIPLPGAPLAAVAEGAGPLLEAWQEAGRTGRPDIRVSLPAGAFSRDRETGSTSIVEGVVDDVLDQIDAIGATDVMVSAQSLAAPGDVSALADLAALLAVRVHAPAPVTTSLTDDVVALGRLHAAYADVVSRRAWGELAGLFRPGAEVHLDLVTSPPRTVVGPGDLGAFIAAGIERFDHFTFVILNSVVDVDGDEATGRLFMCEVRHDRASDTWQNAHGLYQDRFVRVDGRWWFAARRYRSLARTGPDGVVLGLPDGLGPLGRTTGP